MKNFYSIRIRSRKWIFQLLMFLVICNGSVLISNAASPQNQKLEEIYVDLVLSNATPQEFFNQLRERSGVYFFYNNEDVEALGDISIESSKESLKEILDEVFQNSDLEYQLENNVVTVKKAEEKPIQQQKSNYKVSGKVTDEKGLSLPGVTVKLEGTYVGTATDMDGNFSFTSPKKEGVLIVSFVGKKMQKVQFKAGQAITVKLKDDTSNLDEVTITAYGTTTKREMTGSITSVKGEDLSKVPTANLATALQGRVAGLDVTNMSGAPGASGVATVLRGYNSISNGQGSEQRSNSAPLWVIDGVPVENLSGSLTDTDMLSQMDPAMIESVEVLKDASAAALYGSRAANGVILVTTKQGKKGKTKVSANVSYAYSFVPELPTVTAGVDARRFKLEALKNRGRSAFNSDENIAIYPIDHEHAYQLLQDGYYGGIYDYWWGDGDVITTPGVSRVLQDSLNTFYNNSTNWFDEFFKSGKVIDASVQANGGSENFNFNCGLGYYTEEGIMANTGFDRVSLISNLNFTPGKKVKIGLGVFGAYSARTKAGEGDKIPGLPFELSPFYGGKHSIVRETALASLSGIKQKNEDFRLRANLSFSYDVTKNLNFTSLNSVDYSVSKFNYFRPSTLNEDHISYSTGGMADFANILSENLLNYKKSINDRHNLDVLAGYSYQTNKQTTYRGWGRKSPSDYIHYVRPGFPFYQQPDQKVEQLMSFESNFTESVLISFFGRVKYNFDKKYLFEASVRRDGSSKFGRSVPWGTFPAASFGWVFSEESFADILPQMDFGKVRASWGMSGMTFEKPYLAYGLLSANENTFNGTPTIQIEKFGGLLNPKLTWEETTQYNLGLDLDFFNYKFGVILDYYYRYTDKLLTSIMFPGNYSLFRSQWQNAAAVSNEGLELTLKWDVLRKEDFTWKMNFNIAKNWNQFRKSHDGRDIGRNYTIGKPVNGIYVLQSTGIINSTGDLGHRYSTDGVKYYFNAGGNSQVYRMGDIKYVDQNGDGTVDVIDDAIYLGSPLPKAYGGLLSEMKWKNFDLNMHFSYSMGRTILNASKATTFAVEPSSFSYPILADLNRYSFWAKEGDVTDFPRNEFASRHNFAILSDRNVENNVYYVKMKNIVLGYNFTENFSRKLGIAGGKIFLSAENLFTITNYTGIDPETVDINSGIDEGRTYPLVRKFTLGCKVNF